MPLEILEHVVAGDGREGVEPDLARDREQLGRVVVGLVEATKALGDEILERGGGLERAHQPPDAVELGQDARLAEVSTSWRRIPGFPIAAPRMRPATRRDRAAEDAVEERLDGLHGERVDGKAMEMPILDEVVERCCPAGRPHRDDCEHPARLHQ